MASLTKPLRWVTDLFEVLVLDRFHAQRRTVSQSASSACRSLRFHTRSRIRPRPLADLLATMPGARSIPAVTLPGPGVNLGDVGSHSYYHTLASLVQALQPEVILEFGTYLGVGTHTMALNAPPHAKLFTVDLPDDAHAEAVPDLNAVDQGHIRSSRTRVGQAFLNTPQAGRITQIRADSMTFDAKDRVPNANLVLVDGGHSLPVVTRDTGNAFAVLAQGGVILWDDYFHLYPDVVRFLDDLSRQCVLHSIAGTNFVIYHDAWQSARPNIRRTA